jgi:uncharacterized protein (TIRG00374 family)
VSKQIVWNTLKYLLAFGLLAFVIYRNWDPPPQNAGKVSASIGSTLAKTANQPSPAQVGWAAVTMVRAGESPEARRMGLKQSWDEHVVQGKPIQYHFLVFAVVLGTCSLLITLVRWYVLVRAVELPFTVANAIRLGLVGFFFSTFLPGSVGGDLVKAAFIAREQSRRTVAVATVIMDRVIALWALVWLVAISGGIFWALGLLQGATAQTSTRIIIGAAIIVGVSLAVWFLLGLLPTARADRFAGRLDRIPKAGATLAELWRAFWMYRCRTGSVVVVMLMSWVGQIGFVLAFYCCVRAMLDPSAVSTIPTLAEHFLLVPIGLVIQAMPLFPGGAGIAEAGFAFLYSRFGADPGPAVVGMLTQRVINWMLGLVGYFVYLRMKPALRPVSEVPQDKELIAASA